MRPEDADLRALVLEAFDHCPLYARAYAAAGLSRSDLQRPGYFERLPILTAQDFAQAGLDTRNLAVTPYRVSCSSGTSGAPKVLFRTSDDTEASGDIMVRLFRMAGLGPGDRLWIGQPFDLAHVGYLALRACDRLGVLGYPAGLGLTDDRAVGLLDHFQPTAIFTAPSRMAQFTRAFSARRRPPVSKILLAGEPCSPQAAAQIEAAWSARVSNLYGSEETDGLAGSCGHVELLHFMDDQFQLELMEPGGRRPASGGVGEAVVTSRSMRGTPLIRYRLGDIVERLEEPCGCGAPWPLIRVLGRANATFHLYDGVSLHDFQVRSAMARLGVGRHQAVLRSDPDGVDEIELLIDPESASRPLQSAEVEEAVCACSLDLLGSLAMQKLRVRVRFTGAFHRTARGKAPEFLVLREEGVTADA